MMPFSNAASYSVENTKNKKLRNAKTPSRKEEGKK